MIVPEIPKELIVKIVFQIIGAVLVSNIVRRVCVMRKDQKVNSATRTDSVRANQELEVNFAIDVSMVFMNSVRVDASKCLKFGF